MEKIFYSNSGWRVVQSAFWALLSFFFLMRSMLVGPSSLLLFLLFLFVAIDRSLGHIPHAAFLKLDPHGFTTCYWFRKTSYRWCDIAEFKVLTYRYLGIIPFRRQVCFRFTKESGKRNLAMRVVGAIAGFDGALPDSYGMKAKELALLLDRWRQGGVTMDPPQLPRMTSSWPAPPPTPQAAKQAAPLPKEPPPLPSPLQ